MREEAASLPASKTGVDSLTLGSRTAAAVVHVVGDVAPVAHHVQQ